VALADRAQAEDEAKRTLCEPGLIRVGDNTRIEQCRCFKRILAEEVGSDELALDLVELGMALKRIFHIVGAILERLKQIAVTAQKVLEHIGQLRLCRRRVHCEDPVDNVIGARLIRRIEIARLRGGLKRADDDA
jgi:hypothetical protein